MRIHTCEQLSDEWFAVKCGKVSASHFSEVIAKGQGKTRNTYMLRLLGERLTGRPYEAYSTKLMENGSETEPYAVNYYEKLNGVTVERVGFIEVDDYLGISPDGLVGDDGGLEIKCPTPALHCNNILQNKMPTIYNAQVQGSLAYTGRKWWDFVSFCPEVKDCPFWSIRVERNEELIKSIKADVSKFIDELKQKEIEIKARGF